MITVEKIDERTFKVTVEDRTTTTHTVTGINPNKGNSSISACYQITFPVADKKTFVWFKLKLPDQPD